MTWSIERTVWILLALGLTPLAHAQRVGESTAQGMGYHRDRAPRGWKPGGGSAGGSSSTSSALGRSISGTVSSLGGNALRQAMPNNTTVRVVNARTPWQRRLDAVQPGEALDCSAGEATGQVTYIDYADGDTVKVLDPLLVEQGVRVVLLEDGRNTFAYTFPDGRTAVFAFPEWLDAFFTNAGYPWDWGTRSDGSLYWDDFYYFAEGAVTFYPTDGVTEPCEGHIHLDIASFGGPSEIVAVRLPRPVEGSQTRSNGVFVAAVPDDMLGLVVRFSAAPYQLPRRIVEEELEELVREDPGLVSRLALEVALADVMDEEEEAPRPRIPGVVLASVDDLVTPELIVRHEIQFGDDSGGEALDQATDFAVVLADTAAQPAALANGLSEGGVPDDPHLELLAMGLLNGRFVDQLIAKGDRLPGSGMFWGLANNFFATRVNPLIDHLSTITPAVNGRWLSYSTCIMQAQALRDLALESSRYADDRLAGWQFWVEKDVFADRWGTGQPSVYHAWVVAIAPSGRRYALDPWRRLTVPYAELPPVSDQRRKIVLGPYGTIRFRQAPADNGARFAFYLVDYSSLVDIEPFLAEGVRWIHEAPE